MAFTSPVFDALIGDSPPSSANLESEPVDPDIATLPVTIYTRVDLRSYFVAICSGSLGLIPKTATRTEARKIRHMNGANVCLKRSINE